MDKINRVLKTIRTIFYVVEGFFVNLFKKYRFFGLGRFIRRNGSFAVIVFIAAFVSFSNISAKGEDDTFLVGYWQDEKNRAVHRVDVKDELFLEDSIVEKATVVLTEDGEINEEIYQTDVQILAGDNDELLGESTSVKRRVGSGDADAGDDVQIYTVKDGDTVSQIAKDFGVSVNTILWANEVEDVTEIKPGNTLFILPTSGVKHKVKSGDTLDKIAKKYEVEDVKQIIEFNDLPANGEVEEGQELIIPGGEKDEPAALFARRDYVATGTGSTNLGSSVVKNNVKTRKSGNRFPYGYCTYYVAQKRTVTWRGNAGAWLYNAKAQGYPTGKKPQVGAIVVTTEDAYYGHVAYVESVGNGTITVSEMNYKGWGIVNRRTLSQNSRVIKGYIY